MKIITDFGIVVLTVKSWKSQKVLHDHIYIGNINFKQRGN